MSSGATTGVRTYQNFINGRSEPAASGKTFAVYDPASEEVIAQVAEADPGDVDRAVKAAREAFDSGPWPQTTAQDRGRILFKLAEKIRQNSAALAELECRNTGKPIVEAEYDISDVATCFEYYGGLATKVTGQVNPAQPAAGQTEKPGETRAKQWIWLTNESVYGYGYVDENGFAIVDPTTKTTTPTVAAAN